MVNTPKLNLPLIEGDQAQKHVTHNEALMLLDASIQVSVIDQTTTTPPASPSDGDSYLVATGATGAWSSQDGKVAMSYDGAWYFVTPVEGWILYDQDVGDHYKYTGVSWVALSASSTDTWGWQYFRDDASGSQALSLSDTWYDLSNDGAGSGSTTSYAVSGHGDIWDTSTDRLDLTDLSIGDRFDVQINVTVTTTTADTLIEAGILMGEGVTDMALAFPSQHYKDTGAYQYTAQVSGTVFNSAIRDNPVAIRMKSSTTGTTVAVSYWVVETHVR